MERRRKDEDLRRLDKEADIKRKLEDAEREKRLENMMEQRRLKEERMRGVDEQRRLERLKVSKIIHELFLLYLMKLSCIIFNNKNITNIFMEMSNSLF